jgi:hypothetical protein
MGQAEIIAAINNAQGEIQGFPQGDIEFPDDLENLRHQTEAIRAKLGYLLELIDQYKQA